MIEDFESPEELMRKSIMSEYTRIQGHLVTRETGRNDSMLILHKGYKFLFEDAIKNENGEEIMIYSCQTKDCDVVLREELQKVNAEEEFAYFISRIDGHQHSPHINRIQQVFPILSKIQPPEIFLDQILSRKKKIVLAVHLEIPTEFKSPIIISKLVLRDNHGHEVEPHILSTRRIVENEMIIPFILPSYSELKEKVDVELHFYTNYSNQAELILEKYSAFTVHSKKQNEEENECEDEVKDDDDFVTPGDYFVHDSKLHGVLPSEGSMGGGDTVDVFFSISTVKYFNRLLNDRKCRIQSISFGENEVKFQKSNLFSVKEKLGNIQQNQHHESIDESKIRLGNNFIKEAQLCLSSIVIPKKENESPKKVDVRINIDLDEDDDLLLQNGFEYTPIEENEEEEIKKKREEEEEEEEQFLSIYTSEEDTDCFGSNVLFYCIAQNRLDLVKYFVDIKGFDPTSNKDILGFSCMDIALFFHQTTILEYLISKKKEREDETLSHKLSRSLQSQKSENKRLRLLHSQLEKQVSLMTSKNDVLTLQLEKSQTEKENFANVIEKLIAEKNEKFVPVESGKEYYIVNKWSGKCLDNKGQARNGGGFHSWEFKRSNSNQGFRFLQTRNEYYYIINVGNGKFALDNAGSKKNGAMFRSWEILKKDTDENCLNQMFVIIPGPELGFFYIQCCGSKKCLELAQGKLRNGSKIHQWDFVHNSPNQMWRFEKYP